MSDPVTLRKYSVWCITEQALVFSYGFQEEPLTVCPHNDTHIIDTNSITPQESFTVNSVFIEDEKTGTGGRQMNYGYVVTVDAATPGAKQRIIINTPPFQVISLNITINPGAENVDDCIDILTAPDTTVGTTTSVVNIGDTLIPVSGSVINNIDVGFRVKIVNGVNNEELGFVLAIDVGNSTITIQTPSTASYPAGSLIQMSIPRVIKYKIRSNHPITFGDKASGSALLPISLPTAVDYYNHDGAAKEFCLNSDIWY